MGQCRLALAMLKSLALLDRAKLCECLSAHSPARQVVFCRMRSQGPPRTDASRCIISRLGLECRLDYYGSCGHAAGIAAQVTGSDKHA
eukprot:3152261-Rhodomonas_salina.5